MDKTQQFKTYPKNLNNGKSASKIPRNWNKVQRLEKIV